MGILSAGQAKKIKVREAALSLLAPKAERKQSKRIYIRPRKQEKRFTKIKVFNPNRIVLCKICYKKIMAGEAIEVIGGSEQGHKSFWMCREHI